MLLRMLMAGLMCLAPDEGMTGAGDGTPGQDTAAQPATPEATPESGATPPAAGAATPAPADTAAAARSRETSRSRLSQRFSKLTGDLRERDRRIAELENQLKATPAAAARDAAPNQPTQPNTPQAPRLRDMPTTRNADGYIEVEIPNAQGQPVKREFHPNEWDLMLSQEQMREDHAREMRELRDQLGQTNQQLEQRLDQSRFEPAVDEMLNTIDREISARIAANLDPDLREFVTDRVIGALEAAATEAAKGGGDMSQQDLEQLAMQTIDSMRGKLGLVVQGAAVQDARERAPVPGNGSTAQPAPADQKTLRKDKRAWRKYVDEMARRADEATANTQASQARRSAEEAAQRQRNEPPIGVA